MRRRAGWPFRLLQARLHRSTDAYRARVARQRLDAAWARHQKDCARCRSGP